MKQMILLCLLDGLFTGLQAGAGTAFDQHTGTSVDPTKGSLTPAGHSVHLSMSVCIVYLPELQAPCRSTNSTARSRTNLARWEGKAE